MLNNNLSNIIRTASTTQRIELWAANYWIDGAYFALYSKDFSTDNPDDSSAGTFRLSAYQNKVLEGTPNGELIWNNTDLAGAAIIVKSLGSNGYIVYRSGLILQWGEAGQAQTTVYDSYVALPISFAGTSYQVIYTVRGYGLHSCTLSARTSSAFNVNFAEPNVAAIRWLAIGI